jgi:hypothetical protein
MTTDQINLNTQAYRTEAKPRTYVCACGAKATYGEPTCSKPASRRTSARRAKGASR